jgi:[FeFe] hydrogenase H-cluster maturation GTPase HydF
MEIPGIGPVVLTDTAGVDDEGELGKKRVARTMASMDAIDLGILMISDGRLTDHDRSVLRDLAARATPSFVVNNKADLAPSSEEQREEIRREAGLAPIDFCSVSPANRGEVVELMRRLLPPSSYRKPSILGDLVSYGDVVILVTPIDVEAPEGRLILPQVQTIRDCLDNDCVAVVLKERELDAYLRTISSKPRLVVTDSQAFLKVVASVPRDVAMTSFSILFARMKGDFPAYLRGTPHIANLADGDRVLILESCTHHVAGDDIGRVKIPRWLESFTGKRLHFDVVAGMDRPARDYAEYSLVVQCGGCMLTKKQVRMRLKPAIDAGVPVTNYGMTIAYCLGIFDRAIAPFAGTAGGKAEYL